MSELDQEIQARAYSEGSTIGGDVTPSGTVVKRGAPAAPPAQPLARNAALRHDDNSIAADTLQNYLRSIGSIPVLNREETYELAQAIEGKSSEFGEVSHGQVADGVLPVHEFPQKVVSCVEFEIGISFRVLQDVVLLPTGSLMGSHLRVGDVLGLPLGEVHSLLQGVP